MEMHEYLSVNKPLSNETVIERIRSYYLTLMEELCDGESLNREFDVKLSVDGKLFSVVNNIAEIQRGLNALSGKEAFFIDVRTIGFDMAGDNCEMYCFLDGIKETEDITYKYMSFDEKYEEFYGRYIADGQSGNLLDRATGKDVLEKKLNWYSWSCNLYVELDFDVQKSITDALHELVRKYIPVGEIQCAEAEWTGPTADQGALLPDLQWIVDDLSEIMAFIDELNHTLSAFDGNYEIEANGLWFDFDSFAVAGWMVENKKLKMVSTNF